MKPQIKTGDIIDQDVELIVNPWNRNIIPWWLLIPQGVSKAIKKKGGYAPFKELAKIGPMKLGSASLTSAGRLPFRGIIHVAGINLLWIASEYSISESVKNAMKIVNDNEFKSVAFPLIGSGSGNRGQKFSLDTMLKTFDDIDSKSDVIIVKCHKNDSSN